MARVGLNYYIRVGRFPINLCGESAVVMAMDLIPSFHCIVKASFPQSCVSSFLVITLSL